jgi:hypothetical protein
MKIKELGRDANSQAPSLHLGIEQQHEVDEERNNSTLNCSLFSQICRRNLETQNRKGKIPRRVSKSTRYNSQKAKEMGKEKKRENLRNKNPNEIRRGRREWKETNKRN